MKTLMRLTAILLLSAAGAYAAGTAAGTEIQNSASLSYTAGGSTTETLNSNTDTFVVDRKVDFQLTNDDGDQISVLAGAQDQNTTWTLTNQGNADQNFTLESSNLADGTTAYGDADNLDTGDQTIYYSTDGNTWTQYNAGDKIEIAADANISIRVASDIPPGQSNNGKVANIELKATAVDKDGNTEQATSGSDNKNDVDTVLADGAGPGDGQHDAIYTAWGGYIVETPVLDLTKLSCVHDDPVNNTTNPKRIPGAHILYMFDINNTGSSDASGITLSDTLSSNLDGGTVSDVKIDTDQSSCSCSDGADASGLTANNTGSGQNVKIENISVSQGKHTCVSFTVEIK